MKPTEKLVKLAKENPNLPIVASVSFDVVGGDEFRYWVGHMEEVEVDYVYESDASEKYIFGKGDIWDTIFEEIENENPGFFDDMSTKEEDAFIDYKISVLKNAGKIYECIRIDIKP